MDIFEILALICLLGAIGLLITLAIIDLKTLLLPNVYNAALAGTGIAFHLLAGSISLDMLWGALMGASFLYAVRFVANRAYKQDTLGLGDVKLLGAAGLWLGPDHILIAIIIGALAGLAHGGLLITLQKIKTGQAPALSTFSLPAGPGFCLGIFVAGVAKFTPFVQALMS